MQSISDHVPMGFTFRQNLILGPGALCIIRRLGQMKPRQAAKQIILTIREDATQGDFLGKEVELGKQHRSLNRVEPSIDTHAYIIMMTSHAVDAKRPQELGHSIVRVKHMPPSP